MMKFTAPHALAAALGLALGGFGAIEMNPAAGGLKLTMAAPSAEARPVGVARRTTRRVVRRHTVAGCRYVAPYYYCGGVYYRPVIESGKTVYVSVDRTVSVQKNVTVE